MKIQIIKLIKPALGVCVAAAVFVTLGTTLSATAGNAPQPGNCNAHGSSLATWEELYWRWYYGGVTIPTDANGNAIVDSVVLMAQPAAAGDGTPASVDVTLKTGQSFVLPLWVLLGTSYDNGTPPDPFEPVSIFQTLEITFTIDGETVVDSSNAMDYYSQFSFAPPVPLSFSPINGIVWFEGVGIVHHPLTPGKHTFKLHAKNTQLAFGSIFEYNNTWNVTVKPGR